MGEPGGWVRGPRGAGGVVSVLGAVLTGVHLTHGVEEFAEELPAVVYGVGLPLAVSLLVLASGYWIANRTWSGASPWRVVGWFAGGSGVGIVLTVLLVLYQSAEEVALSDPLYVIAMFATYGGAFGLAIGRYDVQRRANQRQLQHEARRLDEFASIVSHDLRNPLNVAIGRLELARQQYDDDDLDHVAQSHERMQALIADLLTLSREGDDVTDAEPVDLAEHCEACWQHVETGDTVLQLDTTAVVRADPSRLQQLLANLFRNAAEHGGGDVTVTVGDLAGGDGFYVADDGVGIPEADRERVFRSGYTTAGEGTGIGLSIASQVAKAHGWELSVAESDTGGARFEIAGVERIS